MPMFIVMMVLSQGQYREDCQKGDIIDGYSFFIDCFFQYLHHTGGDESRQRASTALDTFWSDVKQMLRGLGVGSG